MSPRFVRLAVLAGAGLFAKSALAQEPPPAPAPTIEERLSRAEARLAEQDAEIAALKEKAEVPAWRQVLSAFRLSGFVQADAVLHRQSSEDEVGPTGTLLNKDRFSIPRAHLRLDVDQWFLHATLALEASTIDGPAIRPVMANVSIRWQGPDEKAKVPLLEGTLGLMKIPFGFEVSELDPHRHFLERSTAARALFPGTYDLGFRLHGGYKFVRYSVAVMNGEPTGEASYPGRDPTAAKELIARVGVDTDPARFLNLRAGVSGLSGEGFHKGTPATKDTLVWRDDNEDGLVQLSELQVIAGAPATASQTFHRFAIGADLAVTAKLPVVGELTVFGEVVRAGNLDRGLEIADPISAGYDLRELGFHAGVTQELTSWGMIGARYDRYDPDTDASEQRGVARVPASRAYSTLALTASVRRAPGRLVFEYDRNRNMLGRTPAGLPTNLADDAFTLRGEVVF